MVEYWGFVKIGKRMHWRSIKALHRHIRAYAFPVFKRVDPKNHFRRVWYSNESLISRWEWIMVEFERERFIARDQERQAAQKPR